MRRTHVVSGRSRRKVRHLILNGSSGTGTARTSDISPESVGQLPVISAARSLDSTGRMSGSWPVSLL